MQHTYDEQLSPVLHFIPKPKPLHSHSIVKPQSIYELAACPLDSMPARPEGEHAAMAEPARQKCHQIGNSLPLLFRNPVYKSHDQLNLSNNQNFCQFHNTDKKGQIQTSPHYPPQSLQDLCFSSRFQSGNLALAARVSKSQYNLCLQRDTNNSGGSTQWFFFSVNNRKYLGTVRFNIVNFCKPYSSYNDGLKILFYATKSKIGWQRGCENIDYRRNSIFMDESETNSYYSLSFTYMFSNFQEQVYFSHCYPYTYTRLQKYIFHIEKNSAQFVYRRRLASTCINNSIDCLTITNPGVVKAKPVIFITARAHPGQTLSSYIMEGLLSGLLGQGRLAEIMRNEYIFKIVPMLNPDGVIHGNYRCCLSGVDMNRLWNTDICPQIVAAKNLIKQTKGNKLAFFDLHGHSKKKGMFAYGCMNNSTPYTTKQFPYLMHKVIKAFNYYSCNFLVERCREGTARIGVWRQFGIQHSYTIQTSFLGPWRQKVHFTMQDYLNLGSQLLQAVFQYFCKNKVQEVTQIIEELYSDKQLLAVGQNHSQGSSADSEDILEKPSVSAILSSRKLESSLDDSPENHRSSRSPKKVIFEGRSPRKRTRIQAQLSTKITQINLSDKPTIDEAIPYIIDKLGKVELSDNLWRYTQSPLFGFQHGQKKQSTGSIFKNTTERRSYTSYRRSKVGQAVEDISTTLFSRKAQNRSYSIDKSKTKIYI